MTDYMAQAASRLFDSQRKKSDSNRMMDGLITRGVLYPCECCD